MRIKVPPSLPADATTIIPLLKAISAPLDIKAVFHSYHYSMIVSSIVELKYPKDVLIISTLTICFFSCLNPK
jgi:hypothetical protein